MAKTCAKHPDSAALAECAQCHDALCQACTLVTSAGRFCSPECAVLYRDAKAKGAAKPRDGRGRRAAGTFALSVLGLLLLTVTAVMLIHLEARGDKYPRDHWLKRIDLLGRIIGKGR